MTEQELADIRAAIRQLRDERSPQELDEQAAAMLSFGFLSEVAHLTKARGLTRRALAQAVGTTPSYITQLYRGDRLLNLTMAARFERALGVQFHIKAVSTALPSAAEQAAHPAMLRKLPATLSGQQFAQAQTHAGGGQEHRYTLRPTTTAAANLEEIFA